jgi:ribonuclease D
MLIQTNDQLIDCIAKLKDDKFIAIDTEFMRDKYYYPRLSLIQIGGEHISFAVDALSGVDLNLLKPLLSKKSLVKVFHSCQQDLEVLFNYFGFIPHNIFDTQIALLFLGYKDQPSYETLVRDFLHKQLDKQLQFSDWLLRPLSSEHLSYALDDVILLRQAYELILNKIVALGRLEWLKDECRLLENDTSFYATEADLLKKFVTQLENEDLIYSCLKILRLREKKAIAEDVARNHILHDQDIITILKFSGKPRKTKLTQAEIDEALATQNTSEDKSIIDKVIKLSKLRKGEKVESFMLIRKKLHEIAEKEKISPSLIATSDEIVKFANGIRKNVRFLSGWRKEVFGNHAAELVQ